MSVYWYNYKDLLQIEDKGAYPGLETWTSIYKAFSLIFTDRNGHVAPPIGVRIDPTAKLQDTSITTPQSFEYCCLKRARELFDLAEKRDKPIYLLFSGGLDSTTVAVSFLRSCPTDRLRERLKIVTSTSAWTENPNFLRDHLIGSFEFISIRGFGNYFDGRALVVNGDLSEFCTFAAQNMSEPDIRKSHIDRMFEYLVSCGIEKKHATVWAQILDEDRTRCPIELPTFLDWLWWVRFSWTWQYGMFNTLGVMTTVGGHINNIGEYHERVHPFFNSPEFQLWMMKGNTDRSPGKNMHRAFIREFTHDDEWAKKKQKFHSFTSVMEKRKRIVAIDEKFQALHDIHSVLEHYNPRNDFA